jgi:hypothetical protein
MRTSVLALLSTLAALQPASDLAAEPPPCKETCLAERERLQKRLEECLRQVDPHPPDRAAKMRLLCRQRYSPPRCEGAPPCARQKPAPSAPPGLKLGPMVFSASKRGPALARVSYAAGEEVFLRVEVEVRPRPGASRIWLRMNLRLLAAGKGSVATEVARWDSYAQDQRLLDPAERGLPLRFTLHGGARLPVDLEPGTYRMEAEIGEQVSRFRETASGSFEVRRPRGR